MVKRYTRRKTKVVVLLTLLLGGGLLWAYLSGMFYTGKLIRQCPTLWEEGSVMPYIGNGSVEDGPIKRMVIGDNYYVDPDTVDVRWVKSHCKVNQPQRPPV